jgi:hypothetical protein
MAKDCPIKALIIAPQNEAYPYLPSVAGEVGAAASKLDSVLLQGILTYKDIVNALDKGPFDLVWFSGHSGPAGLLISDGVLPRSSVVSIIRSSRAKLVFINSCENIQIAISILRECDADVIATITSIEDIVAFQTGCLFAQQLAQTCDFRLSYESSKPGEGTNYVYLSNFRQAQKDQTSSLDQDTTMPTPTNPQPNPTNGYSQGQQLERVVNTTDRLKDDLSIIKMDVALLKNDIAAIKTDLITVRSDLLNVRNDLAQAKSDLTQVKEQLSSLDRDTRPPVSSNTIVLLVGGLILVGLVVILVWLIANGVRP